MAIMTIRERHTPGSEVSHVELEFCCLHLLDNGAGEMSG